MNTKIEEKFISSYIAPNKRERLLFELKGDARKASGVSVTAQMS